MSDSPERIWTTGSLETGSWNHQETRMATWVGETEYVRDDLFQALKADNERMREALEKIGGVRGKASSWYTPISVENIARAALQEAENG